MKVCMMLAAFALFACDDGGPSTAQEQPIDARVDSGPNDAGGLDAEIDAGDPLEPDQGVDAAAPDMGPPDPFNVSPGVETVSVTGAPPGANLTLVDAAGTRKVTIVADEFGQSHFAYIPNEYLVFESGEGSQIPVDDGATLRPGTYTIVNDDTDETSRPFTVLAVGDVPDPSFYPTAELSGVVIPVIGGPPDDFNPGFHYLTMRDGVTLSAMVRFPDPLLYGPGPYPTVIEYSGYATSRPNRMEPGTRIALTLGFATVGVNMRGTGCSGGVFDVFNPAQHADGYDIVETIARQPWVLHNKVGMVGLSYSGIAQLFTARTNPPSLAAVTPLSVIADPWLQQWPGGIYNQGFTKSWLDQRDSQASAGGQAWTQRRIADGDAMCEANQQLRNQNIDFESFLRGLVFYRDDAADRSLPLLVQAIQMPVFLMGAFQDEQTGSQFANMLDAFDSAPVARFTLYNGRHPDGYSPMVIMRWFEFLSFYVAKRVPKLHPAVRQVGPAEFASTFNVMEAVLEEDRFAEFGEDYDAALLAYEAEAPVRVLFESGGHPDFEPGAPVHRFEAEYDTFPPADLGSLTLYLDAGGALTPDLPDAEGIDDYQHDPEAGGSTFFGERGYELLAALWDIDWTDYAEGDQLSYLSAPFEDDVVLLGPSVVELWFQSAVEDAHVQVSLSVVRPEGGEGGESETWISSGWLRAGHRKIDEARTDEWRVERTFREADFEPLTPDEPVSLAIPIPPIGQAIRAGERLRLTIATPGRNHGTWAFENPEYDGMRPVHSVLRGGMLASQVRLPIVAGIDVPEGAPACPSLRGQPCRPYVPVANTERAR